MVFACYEKQFPGDLPTGKQMISALLRRQTHSKCGRLLKNQRRNISRISNQFRKFEFWLIPPKQPLNITLSRNDINKSPSALHLEKFREIRKFAKKHIFIPQIGLNLEQFQGISIMIKAYFISIFYEGRVIL